MSALSAMISRSVPQIFWQGIIYSEFDKLLTHMLYADDVTIFGYVNLPNVVMLQVIQQFCHLFGQRINFEKSQLVASDRLNPQVEQLWEVNNKFRRAQK